jgi:drug/metabolite transporter (DMT)-like permease
MASRVVSASDPGVAGTPAQATAGTAPSRDTPSLHRHRPVLAILMWCLAAFLFTTQSAALKWLANDVHFSEILFVRSTVVLICTTFLLARGPGLAAPFRTRRPGLHVARFVCYVASLGCFIQAVKTIPLADATAVTFAAPLMMTALSVPLLKEKVGVRRWSAVGLGLLGVLVLANPSTGIFEMAAVWALVSALGYALAIIITRKLTGTDPAVVIVWALNALYVVVMPLFAPLWVVPTWFEIGLMLLCGIIVLIGQLTSVRACSFAPPQVLAPFDYTGMVWAVLLGLLIWGDVPSWTVLSGAAILIASGSYVLYREARLARQGRRRARAQAASNAS